MDVESKFAALQIENSNSTHVSSTATVCPSTATVCPSATTVCPRDNIDSWDYGVVYFIEQRRLSWMRFGSAALIEQPCRRFSDVFPDLAWISSMGWTLAGSAALWLCLEDPGWEPEDLDFFWVNRNEECPTAVINSTLEMFASMGVRFSVHSHASVLQVSYGGASSQCKIQFIMASMPTLDYLLYNFDTPVSSVAIQDLKEPIATMTPFTKTCIVNKMMPLCPELVDMRTGRRIIRYFRRGFAVRVSDLQIIHRLDIASVLLLEGDNTFDNKTFLLVRTPSDEWPKWHPSMLDKAVANGYAPTFSWFMPICEEYWQTCLNKYYSLKEDQKLEPEVRDDKWVRLYDGFLKLMTS